MIEGKKIEGTFHLGKVLAVISDSLIFHRCLCGQDIAIRTFKAIADFISSSASSSSLLTRREEYN